MENFPPQTKRRVFVDLPMSYYQLLKAYVTNNELTGRYPKNVSQFIRHSIETSLIKLELIKPREEARQEPNTGGTVYAPQQDKPEDMSR